MKSLCSKLFIPEDHQITKCPQHSLAKKLTNLAISIPNSDPWVFFVPNPDPKPLYTDPDPTINMKFFMLKNLDFYSFVAVLCLLIKLLSLKTDVRTG
jgi:hypothetical protein